MSKETECAGSVESGHGYRSPYSQGLLLAKLVPGEVRTTQERNMWKIGEVEPVRVMGAEGYPYGFNVITEDGKPLVSFAYASRALAEAAATHLESALLNALSVHPYAE
jgi:hypothetical protein